MTGDGITLKVLKDIRVESFAHPEEKAALAVLYRAKWLKRALNWIADQQNRYLLKTQVLGNCIGITQKDMPELYHLVREVCETLDYPLIPRLFIYHSPGFRLEICTGTPALLVFPDFAVNEFDNEMLRFLIGGAITALKSDTCQLKMLVAVLRGFVSVIPGVGDAAVALLADWSRKAALTEDRGGLLACQDIEVAEKTLMRMAGMPLKYLRYSCIIPYMRAYQEKPKLASASQYVQTIARTEGWNNDRIVELYQWYYSGQYDDLIEEYE